MKSARPCLFWSLKLTCVGCVGAFTSDFDANYSFKLSSIGRVAAHQLSYMADSTVSISNPMTPKSGPTASTTFPTTPTSIASSNNLSSATGPVRFIKPISPRKRRRSSEDSLVSSIANNLLRKSPAPTTPKLGQSPQNLPRPLTAAAELADQKRRRELSQREQSHQISPNPKSRALEALSGVSGNGMSKLQDAPTPANTLSEAVAAIAPTILIPEKAQAEGSMQTSPVSMSSLTTLDGAGAGTVTSNGQQATSPRQLREDSGGQVEGSEQNNNTLQVDKDEGPSNKALSYPGPLLSAQTNDGRRGMSLPGPSGFTSDSSRSPSSSNKKHKCPYCSTDFTRHHNLKSHLLTHSHEKPYMCQTCDSRFRRLHDLKRHSKLHTGEKPHVCPKCKRSFARGDALARHNKGQGGCAGRRSSVGSYGEERTFDGSSQGGHGGDESMDGLVYTGQASHEPENMEDDAEDVDDRRKSLPSIRRHEAPSDSQYRPMQDSKSTYQSRGPSTYPPVAVRQLPNSGSLYPPNASHGGGSSTSTSPGTQNSTLNQYPPGASGSSTYQVGGSNVFAHGGMTESPKPLSPAGMTSHQSSHAELNIHRNRSPSLTQQFQQHQYGRRTHNRVTPPPSGLPPPMSTSTHSNAPHLPSLPGLTPPDPRFTLHSQTAGPPHAPPLGQVSHSGPQHPSGAATSSSYASQQGGLSSHSNSHSSHGTQPHGSGERANLPFTQGEDRLWAYVRSLESKIDRLQEEVVNLRGQLSGGSHR